MASKTILFIHGMFMNSLCWEDWVERFRANGYTCVAPAWQLHDGAPAALRAKHPDPALGKLTLTKVVNQFDAVARGLPEKPIIIGHSMGGLVTQILAARGTAAAAVGVDPAPPQGVFALSYPFLKSNFPIINPLISADEPMLMTRAQFDYGFGNTLLPDAQQAAYDRYMVPESRRIGRGSLGSEGKVDYTAVRVPLLILAGERDHIIPPVVNRANFKKYRGASNVTLREFAGRSHFIIGEPGWQEVADAVRAWIEQQAL